jgi:hypothetical protein
MFIGGKVKVKDIFSFICFGIVSLTIIPLNCRLNRLVSGDDPFKKVSCGAPLYKEPVNLKKERK